MALEVLYVLNDRTPVRHRQIILDSRLPSLIKNFGKVTMCRRHSPATQPEQEHLVFNAIPNCPYTKAGCLERVALKRLPRGGYLEEATAREAVRGGCLRKAVWRGEHGGILEDGSLGGSGFPTTPTTRRYGCFPRVLFPWQATASEL